MPRNVLFLGNCQAEMIAGAAAKVFADNPDLSFTYLPNYSLSDAKKAALIASVKSADIIFLQRAQFDIGWLSEQVPAQTRLHYFPALRVTFLWPDSEKVISGGGDGTGVDHSSPLVGMRASDVLLKLSNQDLAAKDVVAGYLRTNVADDFRAERQMKLDRITMQHLGRDTDLDLWSSFDRTLRTQRPYFSPWHPDWSLLEPVARYVIDVLGQADPRRLQAIMTRYAEDNHFSNLTMPVHPSILKNFGLKWAKYEPAMYNVKYGYADMASYVRLYLTRASMTSYQVYYVSRANRLIDRAITAARRVLARRIGDPSTIHLGLAELLVEKGSPEEAEAVLGEIVDLYQYDPKAMAKLSGIATRIGAFSLADQALSSGPEAGQGTLPILRRRLALLKAQGLERKARDLATTILQKDWLDEGARQALGMASRDGGGGWKIGRQVQEA